MPTGLKALFIPTGTATPGASRGVRFQNTLSIQALAESVDASVVRK
jgi:hypothetical protein